MFFNKQPLHTIFQQIKIKKLEYYHLDINPPFKIQFLAIYYIIKF